VALHLQREMREMLREIGSFVEQSEHQIFGFRPLREIKLILLKMTKS